MALTLVQFWQAERDTHEAAQTAAQKDLAMAQKALVSAKSTLDANVTTLNKLNAGIAANRAKLPTTSIPSELTALNTVIRDQLNTLRALHGTIFDDQDAVSEAEASVTTATTALTRTRRRLADTIVAFDLAKSADTQRQSMKAQLAAAPFDTLQADATAAAAGAVATDAKAEIDANFPAELQTIANKRYATRTARALALRQSLTAAETARGSALANHNGLAGKAAQQAIAFSHADHALRDYANAAKQRLDRAMAVLGSLQAMKNGTKLPDLLSAQEKHDVATNAARTTAATNVESVDVAHSGVDTASNDLDTQILTQIAADVDTLATDATVKAKRDAVVAKAAALKAAQDAADASGDRKTMDDWQIVVQDGAWQSLIDYLDARAVLADLTATTPATLTAALDAAETAYATALAAASKAEREADALADAIALRTDRATAASAALPGRLLSAVRGDSY